MGPCRDHVVFGVADVPRWVAEVFVAFAGEIKRGPRDVSARSTFPGVRNDDCGAAVDRACVARARVIRSRVLAFACVNASVVLNASVARTAIPLDPGISRDDDN